MDAGIIMFACLEDRRMNNVVKNIFQMKIEEKLSHKKSGQYVLMFHSVTQKEMWYHMDFCITPESFENMILELKNRGVRFAAMDEIEAGNNDKTVYITFDDIFADVFLNAYPILKKYNIPFAVFISVGYIGKTNMISKKMLRALSEENLCTIGAHTFSHVNLSACTILELIREIYGARRVLESFMKKKVEYMAYPYGQMADVPLAAMAIAFFVGYRRAFSTITAPVCRYMRYLMPRINVNEHNWKRVVNKCSK